MTDDATTPEPSAKGRSTRSRKEAEAERRRLMKQPLTRRQKMERERAARAELRAKQRESLQSGSGSHLPARDRGPVKTFVRDFVDRRWNVAEFLLPILVLILIISMTGGDTGAVITAGLWSATLVSTVFDEFVLVRGLKKELRERFPDESHRRTTSYAVLRSTQLRRFRLPKPAIARGGAFRSRY